MEANLRQHGDDARHLIAEARLLDDLRGASIINRPTRRSHTSSQSSQSKLTLLVLIYANTPVFELRGPRRFASMTNQRAVLTDHL